VQRNESKARRYAYLVGLKKKWNDHAAKEERIPKEIIVMAHHSLTRKA